MQSTHAKQLQLRNRRTPIDPILQPSTLDGGANEPWYVDEGATSSMSAEP